MTTKFSIGQEVWFMHNDKPQCMPVCSIHIQSEPRMGSIRGTVEGWKEPTIRYYFFDGCNETTYSEYEEDVFATKDELRDAIFNK